MIRIGHGFDLHRFGAQKPLILGGVEIPYSQGLIAHSDGDVVLHAVSDALLGAIAARDIGYHFPDTSSEFKDVDSKLLLQRVYALVKERGFLLGNLDVTVLAQAPKLSPHIEAMRDAIAEILEAKPDQVNVKATTTEKVGTIGRQEAIATEAVVLINRC
ncbi:2-C-methyl-D-erythritol 2,4-cyclodiphosphate synthase [Dongshaea marina]|uniref:2-C-methyl-D-erythritol 2,4-cyclodiphosphate synthase n=1 Tax=Dongshaea marina TaxID=2047966 RepID=UPI000D3E68F3|nr:2-C-methyl-D-erythritol 2,4-cyclodiphosphate synthase [Dongshaea marina]